MFNRYTFYTLAIVMGLYLGIFMGKIALEGINIPLWHIVVAGGCIAFTYAMYVEWRNRQEPKDEDE